MEDERRLAQPGDDAAGDDLRLPRDRMPAALERDPFVDQGAGIGAVDGRIGRAQMAQPAEAEQHVGPFLRGRRHLEGRAAVAHHHLAGEGEAAGIDFGGAGRIGGAQLLRRDDETLRRAHPVEQPGDRMDLEARPEIVEPAAKRQKGQPRAVRDHDGHGRWPLLLTTNAA